MYYNVFDFVQTRKFALFYNDNIVIVCEIFVYDTPLIVRDLLSVREDLNFHTPRDG